MNQFFSSAARSTVTIGRTRTMRILALALWAILISPMAAFGQAVPLGTSADFGVLAGSAVTNTGSTVIDGSVGVSPGTSITGFPPGSIQTGTGTIHSADAVALQAQSDLTVAYNTAASAACNTNIPGGVLAGLTLTPGVYCMDEANLSGTLTLNGAGPYIFQAASSLTVGSGATVALINGASSCDVYWLVTSSATVGTSASMVGNILALTSITLNTSAHLRGRMLARNGAVTLDSNTLSACTSAAAPPPGLTPTTIDIVAVPTTIVVGTPAQGQSNLNGGSTPTGTVTFQLFPQNTCAGIPLFTTSVNVAGNGQYTSPGFVPGSAGTFSWRATYSGDAANASSISACAGLTVTALPPATPPSTTMTAPLSTAANVTMLIAVAGLGALWLRRRRGQFPDA